MSGGQLRVVVEGQPVQQGSKSVGRHGQLYDAKGHQLKAWRTRVAWAAKRAAQAQQWPLGYDCAVRVDAVWYVPRPGRSKFGDYPAGPPDTDKLERALGDALTESGVIADDARITRWVAGKEWAEPGAGGSVAVTVTALGTTWVPFHGLEL